MRTHALTTAAALTALFFTLPYSALAQEQRPRDQFEEEIVVSEVLLDVLVTDKRGNVIVGLGPEDFVVEEDGKVIELTSVSFYSNRRSLDEETGEESRADRFFILMMHDQRKVAPFLTAGQVDAGRWMRRWVDQEMLPNDWVAVTGYDAKLKIYQDYTHDREKLKAAIDRAALGKRGLENWPSRQVNEEGVPSLLDHLPTEREIRRQTRKIQQGLELLAEAAGNVIGRKNLLLFSVGFGNVSPAGFYQPDIRYYPPMKEALNDNNVAVYTIDMNSTQRGGSPSLRSINDALSSISSDTGGRYYQTFTNVLTPMRQVSEDNNGYYLLAFQSEHLADSSGYREVSVKARNPEFRVRARKGYKFGSDT